MEISNLGFYFNKGYYSDKYKGKEDYLKALKNKTENKKNEEKKTELDNFIETKVDDKIWGAYKHLDDLFAKNSKVTRF